MKFFLKEKILMYNTDFFKFVAAKFNQNIVFVQHFIISY